MADTTRPGALSQVAGLSEPALWDITIPALLDRAAAERPAAEAAVFADRGLRWTWAEFAAAVDRLATGLLDLGVRKGDRVGIWSPNRPEWLLSQFATARIGAILVTVNPAYRVAELDYALRKVGVSVLILAPAFKTSDYLAMIGQVVPELGGSRPGALRSAALPDLRAVVRMGPGDSAGILAFDPLAATPPDPRRLDAATATLSPADPINIQFTSGTTGLPKGATLTHRNIVNNARFTTATMRFNPADRLCIPVPLYHSSAWSWARSAVWPRARPWSFRARASTLWPPFRPWNRSAARRFTACRRCSLPCSTIPTSPAST